MPSLRGLDAFVDSGQFTATLKPSLSGESPMRGARVGDDGSVMVLGSRTALLGAVVVLAAANVLNNWLAPSAYLVTAVAASAMLLGLLRGAGGTWADAGLGRDAMRRGFAWGLILAAGITVAVVVALLTPAARHLFLDPRVEGTGSSEVAIAALVRVPFGTVLLEEIGFRGVVYALAARMWGFAWATVISSGLFGLWHVMPAIGLTSSHPAFEPLNAVGSPFGATVAVAAAMLAASAAGAVMCELRRRSGSLIPPLALHWTVNALGYVSAYLAFQAVPEAFSPFERR